MLLERVRILLRIELKKPSPDLIGGVRAEDGMVLINAVKESYCSVCAVIIQNVRIDQPREWKQGRGINKSMGKDSKPSIHHMKGTDLRKLTSLVQFPPKVSSRTISWTIFTFLFLKTDY